MIVKSKQLPENPNYLPYILIIVLSLIVYGNTLTNKYALDDRIVILDNAFTKKGIAGISDILSNEQFTGFFGQKKDLVTGGRYRPFSMVTFAIEYELFGLNPFISHLINILLFGMLCLILLRVLEMIKKDDTKDSSWYWQWPFLAAVLFTIHPIHTEAVANIKGRDEILAMLGGLLAIYFSLKFIDSKKTILLLYSFISIFLGLLSKEIAIIFVILVPFTIFWFRKCSIKDNIMAFLPVILGSLIFLIIRHQILGDSMKIQTSELMNNPFVGATQTEKYATILYTLGLYIKLLIIPHPLTYDYYPYHIQLVDFSNMFVWISIILYLSLIIIAFYNISKNSLVSYAILFYVLPLALVSNIFFPVGVFMNERFIFVSSVGFCILAGVYIQRSQMIKKYFSYPVLILVAVAFLLFSIKTITRNKTWQDDFTLFTTDVKTSYNSAKSNCSAGGILFETAQSDKDSLQKQVYLKQSIEYLYKAIQIYPQYTDALLLLGNAYWESNHNVDSVLKYYHLALLKSPGHTTVLDNLRIIANATNNIPQEIRIYEYLNQQRPNDFETNYQLGNLYGKHMNDIEHAIQYLTKAYTINRKDAKVLKDLGVAHAIKGDLNTSLNYFEKALEQDSTDADLYLNIGITYQRIGNLTLSTQYINKGLALKQQKVQDQ